MIVAKKTAKLQIEIEKHKDLKKELDRKMFGVQKE